MPSFSLRSQENLNSCSRNIQDILNEAIKYIDFAVICGHRGMEEQNRAYEKGTSKLKWPLSKHNKTPSHAVDLLPYPYDWNDIEGFHILSDVVMGIAERRGIGLTWGGSWNFKDLAHFEEDDND